MLASSRLENVKNLKPTDDISTLMLCNRPEIYDGSDARLLQADSTSCDTSASNWVCSRSTSGRFVRSTMPT